MERDLRGQICQLKRVKQAQETHICSAHDLKLWLFDYSMCHPDKLHNFSYSTFNFIQFFKVPCKILIMKLKKWKNFGFWFIITPLCSYSNVQFTPLITGLFGSSTSTEVNNLSGIKLKHNWQLGSHHNGQTFALLNLQHSLTGIFQFGSFVNNGMEDFIRKKFLTSSIKFSKSTR